MFKFDRQLRVLTFALLAGCIGCWEMHGQEWHSFPGGRWRELPHLESAPAGFTRKSPAETGLLFTNVLSDFQGGTNRTLYNGSGVAAGDIDADGRPDIILAGINHPVAVFKNLGDWRFTNVTAAAGLQLTNFQGRAAALVDINGDRHLDLLLAGQFAGIRAFQNNGKGGFEEITARSGLSSSDATVTMAFADVDGDGAVDLYAANNRSEDIRDHGQVQLRLVGGQPVVPAPLQNRLVFQEGQLLEYGEADRLYLNNGEGAFKQVSFSEVFRGADGRPLAGPPLDWGLTATFRDFNSDGAPDLYVCNDFWTPDRIWINDGQGHFKAASALAFRQISGSSMGVDLADLNEDGRPEIFVVDMLSRWPSWRKRQMAAQPTPASPPGVITNQPQILRNTLFLAREDGTYAEVANYAGLPAAEWAWQPIFIDVDLDGDMDLLITTGHAHDVQDRDAEMQIRARQKNYGAIKDPAERKRIFSDDLRVHMALYPPLETPVVAFRNEGGLKFTDVTEQWGTSQAGIHHGIATADFDGDGDLDFVVNKLNAPAALYENQSGAARVAMRLKGRPPNTAAIGAVVTLTGGSVPSQTQEVVAGGRYLSSSDPLLVFAADPAKPMATEIRWRDGSSRMIPDVRANRLYEIDRASGENTGSKDAPVFEKPQPLFEDVSSLISHTHTETLYDDFLRQPTLPWRLSQSGPGVAWADLDQDGWDDLFIGTGAGGRVGAFRNQGDGTFKAFEEPFAQPLPRDTTSLIPIPGPTGKTSLLAGLASYEDGRTNTASLLQFTQGNPAPMAVWKDLPGSLGPVAPADYDGDGDLDLFLGARVTPARWPEGFGSVLLLKDQNAWRIDQANSDIFASSNSVTSAIWSDLDNDGFPELILAGEYAPLRIFKNSRGKLSPLDLPVRPASARNENRTVAAFTGLWNSVAAGDFDGDGRMDLLAGNWGENSEYSASFDEPLLLLGGPWSGSSALSLLETVPDPQSGSRTVVRALDELASSFPFLVGRFNTFRAFSEASVEQLLGEQRSKAREFRAVTLKSALFLNRGDHFVHHPLPFEAQLSPIFGIAVADFNGDGAEDAFLAQNFFATRPGIPRLDAGRGLLLLGDGSGGFTAASGSEAGITVYGEQRGTAVADYDQDGRTDLVVTQNGAATRLFRNNGSPSGIRVELQGPPGNPFGFGAALRLVTPNHTSPVREIHAAHGYWSSSSPASIVHWPKDLPPASFAEVRWPGGKTTRHALTASSSTLVFRHSD